MRSNQHLDRNAKGWAVIRMKFDPQEADKVERLAAEAGMPVVPYLYSAVLGKQVTSEGV
jgi:hypothetical protein